MVLTIEIICLLLVSWAVYKTIPRPRIFDEANYFRRALRCVLPDPPADLQSLTVDEGGEEPCPLLTWENLDATALKAQLKRRLSHLVLLGFETDFAQEIT